MDKAGFNTAEKAMSSIESGVASFAGTAVKTFGAAAAAMAAFGVAAATASVKFLNGLAQQQINMEILSRQLWTTQQQAQAFNATLNAMGTNLQSLYLSPTLMSQYQQLHSVAMGMTTPGDYNQQIQQIQNIRVQFEQMKLEAYYALQWIGYWFIKYMQGPITNVHNLLQEINTAIVKNMPTWTKQAAQWMVSFWQAGVQIVTGLKDVWNWFGKLASDIPTWAKVIGGALALISVSNPFMLFVEGIGAAILLWNDWQTYLKDPSKSAFPTLWAWVDKLNQKLSDLHIGKQIGDDIKSSFDALGQTFQNVWNWLKKLYNQFNDNGTFTEFQNNIDTLWSSVQFLYNSIVNLITSIGNLYAKLSDQQGESGLLGFAQMIADVGNTAIQLVSGAVYTVGILAKMVSDVMNGKWKDAAGILNFFNGGSLPQGVLQSLVPKTSYTTPGGYGPASMPYMWSGSASAASSSSTSNSSSQTIINVHQGAVTTNITGNPSPSAVTAAGAGNLNKIMHNIRPTY